MVINSVFILLRITTIMRKKQLTMLLWGYLLPLQTLFWLSPPKNRNSFGLWETCQNAWRPPKKNPPEAPDLILDLNDHWGTPKKNHCWTQKSCGLWLADIKRSKTSPSTTQPGMWSARVYTPWITTDDESVSLFPDTVCLSGYNHIAQSAPQSGGFRHGADVLYGNFTCAAMSLGLLRGCWVEVHGFGHKCRTPKKTK